MCWCWGCPFLRKGGALLKKASSPRVPTPKTFSSFRERPGHPLAGGGGKHREGVSGGVPLYPFAPVPLEYLTLEMLAYGRQKPAFLHFVARIFKKILAEQLTHFIRKLL